MEPTQFSYEKHINTPADNDYYDKRTWSFISSLSIPEFEGVTSCYEVHEKLVKAKVVRTDNDDHEHSCCYYYFYSKKAAENFIKRLNEYCRKKCELMAAASNF